MILNTTTEQGLAPDVIDEVDENTTYLGFFQPGTSNCLIKRILKVDTITTIQYPNGQYDFIHDWDQRTVYNYSFRKQMSSLTDKIQQLFTTKQRIKSAIVAKGVKVSADVPFADYATKIEEIPQVNPDDWKPHPDWPDISEVADNEIKLLVADGSGIAFATTVANNGTFSINWGDGTIEHNCASGSTKEHQYVPGSGTPCSIGYSTYVVRIFNATDNITLWKVERHSFQYAVQYFNILWININARFLTSYEYLCGRGSSHLICSSLQRVEISSFENSTSCAYAFYYCYSLKSVILPDNWGNNSSLSGMFYYCTSLSTINLPETWGNVLHIGNMFSNCSSLKTITFPNDWGFIGNVIGAFSECSSLQMIIIPTSWKNITVLSSLFKGCKSLTSLNLPDSWGNVTSTQYMFQGCSSIGIINLPDNFGNITAANNMFSECYSLQNIEISKIGSIINQSNLYAVLLACVSYNYPVIIESLLSQISINGYSGTQLKISSIRLTNPGSLFSGSSPQVNVSYTSLPQAALVDLFNDLPVLAGKTINITGCTGSAALTPEERAIATNKGWTIIG